MIRFFSALIDAFKWERLDVLPAPEETEGKPSLLQLIAASEKLPRPSVSVPPNGTPLWKWLLLPEKLPFLTDSPLPGEGKSSLFTILFSSETLHRDPKPEKKPVRRRRRGGGSHDKETGNRA